MPVGLAPTGKKLKPGTVGSASTTCPLVRSTIATSPCVVCVTIANAERLSPSVRLVSGQSSTLRGSYPGRTAVGLRLARHRTEKRPFASSERSVTGCVFWVHAEAKASADTATETRLDSSSPEKSARSAGKVRAPRTRTAATEPRRVESIYLEALGGVRCPTLSTILPYVSVWRWSRSIAARYESEKCPT